MTLPRLASTPSATAITLRLALASGVLLSGLTAPSMRAALVLMSRASEVGHIDMLKPELERLAGLRLDNANKLIERLLTSAIDIPAGDDPDNGEPVFDELSYTPGIEKRFAGVITGHLSPAFRSAVGSMRRAGTMQIEIDVLRRLTTIPGIIMYLRLQAERQRSPRESVFRIRLRDTDAFGWFGQYCRQASTGRKNAAGDEFRSISLGRIFRHLIEPGIRDLGDALNDMDIDAVAGIPEAAVRGRAWSHVDIVARRLKRVSIKDLADRQDEQARHRGRVEAQRAKSA